MKSHKRRGEREFFWFFNARAHLGLARSLEALDRFDDALKEYGTAARLDPSSTEARSGRDLLERLAASVSPANPTGVDTPRALAQARICLDRLEADACRAALATGLSPDRAVEIRMFSYIAEPGLVADESLGPLEPEYILREVTRLNPRSALGWYLLGGALVYSPQGGSEDAYRRAIALERDWIAAYERLACVLRIARKDAEAAEVLREAVRRLPEDPRLVSDLGAALTAAQRWADAIAVLQPIADSSGASYADSDLR